MGNPGTRGVSTGLSLSFTKLHGCLFVAVLKKRQIAEISITFNSETREHANCASPQECISSCLGTAALKLSSCIHKYALLVGSFAAAAVGHHECQEPFKIAKI